MMNTLLALNKALLLRKMPHSYNITVINSNYVLQRIGINNAVKDIVTTGTKYEMDKILKPMLSVLTDNYY